LTEQYEPGSMILC